MNATEMTMVRSIPDMGPVPQRDEGALSTTISTFLRPVKVNEGRQPLRRQASTGIPVPEIDAST